MDATITSRTPLRPDPDVTSSEILSLDVNDRVSRLRDLGPWTKISFTDKTGTLRLGWVPSNVLADYQPKPIRLYDEPFGQSRDVSGDIVERGVELPPWRKVRVRLDDGTTVGGWITSANGAVEGAGTQNAATSGAGQEGGGDLELGPNEVYRAHLLEAKARTGIDAAALAALISAEAAKLPTGEWNRNSSAGTSSAAGLTQFLAATWLAQARRKGTLLNETAKASGYVTAVNTIAVGRDDDVLALRFDPRQSIVAAAEYGVFNLDALVKDGLVAEDVGDDEKARFIYLAHHEGLEGARAFLKGTKSYTFSDLATQVGQSRAQRLIDAADGDTTKAYRNWLNDYVEANIQPSRFRSAGAAVPASGGEGTRPLAQFDGSSIPVADLSRNVDLAKAIQWRLSELGYLDPPADGMFGPVSTWALSEFCDLNGISLNEGFTRAVAERLLAPRAVLPAIATGGNWFDKVIAYMQQKKYFICRHPDAKNIIYLEGVNPDSTLNDDEPNKFNDLRIVFSIDARGRADFDGTIWDGTTEPGRYWTMNPMNPKGAARIAFNQYKAWVVGTHHPGSSQAHEALVQAEPVSVYRDLNKDFKRPGDLLDTGLFAINQHWGYDAPRDDLGRTSAGCLVGRTRDGHRKFMAQIKNDPRYKVNNSYRFVTAVMPGDEVLR